MVSYQWCDLECNLECQLVESHPTRGSRSMGLLLSDAGLAGCLIMRGGPRRIGRRYERLPA